MHIKSGICLKLRPEDQTWIKVSLVLESEGKTLQVYKDTDKALDNVLSFIDLAGGAEVEATTTQKANSFSVKTTGAEAQSWDCAASSAAISASSEAFGSSYAF